MLTQNKHSGFTLAELLIALAILGVIATFTIPKIMTAQTNSRNLAEANEVAGMMTGALQKYNAQYGIVPGTSTAGDLFQYMNYVKIDTSTTIDGRPLGSASAGCWSGNPCLRLHNGGILYIENPGWYSTDTTSAISFLLDPDGVFTGNQDSVSLNLYTDGAIRCRSYIKSNTTYGNGAVRGPGAGADPTWLTW